MYDYDIAVIGMGPGGMAVSAMGAEMGLKVCAIEARALGGECMNVGCIPSKALLRVGKLRHAVTQLVERGVGAGQEPRLQGVFERLQKDLKYIGEAKTRGMFEKVELLLQQGRASFADDHTLLLGERRISAKRIFIATGTSPMLPEVPGLTPEMTLTNDNLFSLPEVPARLVIWGGGTIACEMAQAFRRMGAEIDMVIRAKHLLRRVDPDAVSLLEETLQSEGVRIHRETSLARVEDDKRIVLTNGEVLPAAKVLVALGRKRSFEGLNLEAAGVRYTEKGIEVNNFLQTSVPHIYAVGDCNGFHEFSHAAMHQSMLALMNCMLPWPSKLNFRKYVVPSTIFTEPQVSQVGASAQELTARRVRFETVKVNYADYGAAIAEGVDKGFVKVHISRTGKILGAGVVGEGSADMINEWGLAVQKGLCITSLLMLQHSFPSMSFLNKRIAETWMMNRMKGNAWMRLMARVMFRF